MPSASGSELSLSFLLSMSPSTPPESPPTARTQFFAGGVRLRLPLIGLGTLNDPLESASRGILFGVSRFAHAPQPAELLASLADLTRQSSCPADGGFYF